MRWAACPPPLNARCRASVALCFPLCVSPAASPPSSAATSTGQVGGSRVFLHPSCVLFGESVFEHARWLAFTSKQQASANGAANPHTAEPPHTAHPLTPTCTLASLQVGSGGADAKTYVRDVTAVSPLALLLFGGEVEVHHDQGTVTIDGQISMEAAGVTAVLVRKLRETLDKLLSDKIAQPALEIQSHPVLATIVDLLKTEKAGFS